MNSLKAEASEEEELLLDANIENNIRALVRGEVVPLTKTETIRPPIQKVGAASIAEIDNLIGELQAARSYLQSEAERIEREMARYMHLSETASASVKVITQSVGQWRKAHHTMSTPAAEAPPD